VLELVLEYHPHGSLADLLRVLGRSGHGSILSRAGASKIPGAVQVKYWPRCSYGLRGSTLKTPQPSAALIGHNRDRWLAVRVFTHSPVQLASSTRRTLMVDQATTPADRVHPRSIARVAGWLYLLTFVSIPTLSLYGPVRRANYIAGPGPDTRVYIGVILEVIVALAGIGTAVALFPVVKRQDERRALGFVGARVLEAALIFAGILSLMTVVTLRRAGADSVVTGQALVGLHDWTASALGQGLLPVVNALLLGSLLYQSRLVPRILPLLGLIGALLLLASDVATVFGVTKFGAPITGLASFPIALWEFSLGVYLIVKGFSAPALRELGFAPDVSTS
jgi:hypothetical protein